MPVVNHLVPLVARRRLDAEVSARKTYVRKVDLERFGYTLGCVGCANLQAHGNTRNMAHTEVCRARVESKLQDSAEGRQRLAETVARQPVIPRAEVSVGSAPAPAPMVVDSGNHGNAEPQTHLTILDWRSTKVIRVRTRAQEGTPEWAP